MSKKIGTQIDMDLIIVNLLSFSLIVIVVTGLSQIIFFKVLRLFLAFLFVTFFPGYLLTKLFFSEQEISTIERVGLSFYLSMIVVPIIGLALAYSPLRIELWTTLFSVYLYILIMSVIGHKYAKYTLKGKKIIKFNLKTINTILTIILIIVIGIFVRVYPATNYSLFGGNWIPGNHIYPIYYTLQTGELLFRGVLDTPTLFSSTIYNALHNKAFILYETFIFLLSGFISLGSVLWLNKFFPIYGVLIFPLGVLLVTSKIWNRIPTYYTIFLYFVSVFASFKLLIDSRFMTNNLIIGYSFIFLTIYFLKNNSTIKNRILAIISSMFIFLYYYTAGLIFLVLLMVIFALQNIRKEKIISNIFIVIYIFLFISYYMYLAYIVFRSYIVTLEKAILYPGAMPMQAILGREVIKITIPYISAYLNLILIGFLLVMFVYWWIKGDIKRNQYTNLVSYLIFGLVLIFIIFFLWRGLKGVARLNSYAALLFLLALPILLRRKDLKKIFALVVAMSIVTTSLIAYFPGTVMHVNYLTYPESGAIIWYCNHRSDHDGFVFTDSRVGTAPIMLNCFTFTGISGDFKRYPYEKRYLVSIYYKNNVFKAIKVLSEYKASYILLSKEMKEYGVVTLADVYKPVSQKNLIKYEVSIYFGKIYNNNKTYIYKLQN